MIRTYRVLIFFSIACTLLASCGSPTGSSGSSKFEGVPSGEIVPVEKRDSVLTGIAPTDSTHTKAKGMTQKWWLHDVSEIDYKGCEGYQDSTITFENTYFAFTPDGEYYQKVGETGSKQYKTSWKWSDESKSAIILGIAPDTEFEIRSLNENEVIYASSQPQGGGCEVVTWEQFGEPITDVAENNVGSGEKAGQFTYDEATYDLNWGMAVDQGVYNEEFRNVDFFLFETEENWAEAFQTGAELSENSDHFIVLSFDSFGASTFTPGVYEYSSVDINANHLNGATVDFTFSSESFFVTDGFVEISYASDEEVTYTLVFELLLNNGKVVEGMFEAPVTHVDPNT